VESKQIYNSPIMRNMYSQGGNDCEGWNSMVPTDYWEAK